MAQLLSDEEVMQAPAMSGPSPQPKLLTDDEIMQPAAAMPAREPSAALPTVSERAQEVYGLDPTMQKRGEILPIGVNKEGKPEWAVPQIGVDLMESLLVPGRAAQGENISPEEAAKFTLDFAAPAVARRLPGGLRTRPATRKEAIKAAPTTEELLSKGGKQFEAARATGAKLTSDQYVDFLSKVETTLNEEGVDQFTKSAFPKLSGVIDSFMARLGREPDIRDLQIMRKQIVGAVGSRDADEARIAGKTLNILDDAVDDLTDLPKEARALWAAGKKSQTIEAIVEKAEGAASGLENGLRIGFRQLLNNKKSLRGFTKEEIAVMKQIRDGTLSQKALRFIGKAGPGTSGSANFLGASIGSTGGATVGGLIAGPVGAVVGGLAVPAVGFTARKGAEVNALRNTGLLRALAAMGGSAPRQATNRLATGTAGAGLPVAGAQLPKVTQSAEDQNKLARMLAEEGL